MGLLGNLGGGEGAIAFPSMFYATAAENCDQKISIRENQTFKRKVTTVVTTYVGLHKQLGLLHWPGPVPASLTGFWVIYIMRRRGADKSLR